MEIKVWLLSNYIFKINYDINILRVIKNIISSVSSKIINLGNFRMGNPKHLSMINDVKICPPL